ncbi:MAG: hypothetical protein H6Q30_2083 [Bacteroidetes bacterium]|jgi:hypothetical protein|nr:hypothetical protein [Bacteroidota bacterium]
MVAETNQKPPMNDQQEGGMNPGLITVTGFATLAAVLLAFGAFDDITTDDAKTFTVEYALLVASGCWCLLVAISLLARRRIVFGLVSLILLAAAIWGQRAIGPGTLTSARPEYIATVIALCWFLVLSGILVVYGFRRLV